MGKRVSGSCIKNTGYPVIASNLEISIGRQRFFLTHVLFHLSFDASEHAAVCAKKINGGNEIEKSADQFASYFPMPSIALESFVKNY